MHSWLHLHKHHAGLQHAATTSGFLVIRKRVCSLCLNISLKYFPIQQLPFWQLFCKKTVLADRVTTQGCKWLFKAHQCSQNCILRWDKQSQTTTITSRTPPHLPPTFPIFSLCLPMWKVEIKLFNLYCMQRLLQTKVPALHWELLNTLKSFWNKSSTLPENQRARTSAESWYLGSHLVNKAPFGPANKLQAGLPGRHYLRLSSLPEWSKISGIVDGQKKKSHESSKERN